MSKDMFRYLMKYVGKYRVLTELTPDTHDFVRDKNGNIHPDYDELYIECNYGGKIKHSYKEDILSYWTDKISTYKSTLNKFKENKIKYQLEDAGEEYIIYFNDADMDKVAKLVGAKTLGKKIKPFDEKNIPDRIIVEPSKSVEPIVISVYKIPPDDMKPYYSAISPLPGKSEKMQLVKQTLVDFDAVIKKSKGIDPVKEKEKLNINPKEYIHSIGMWDEYIKFLKNAVEESFKK